MTKLHSYRFTFWTRIRLVLPYLALSCFAHGQILHQDQEIQVHNLPSLMARSHDPSDVLLTSLDTVFHDRGICCGKDSALEDSASAADPGSLKDVASKLNGRHLLGDGRPIKVTAEYVPTDAMNAGSLISAILNQHAALLEWNSHLYVVYGLVYFWSEYGGGGDQGYTPVTVIHKLLLWDTRYSDSRREVVFNRDTDDMSKIQGLLFLQAELQ